MNKQLIDTLEKLRTPTALIDVDFQLLDQILNNAGQLHYLNRYVEKHNYIRDIDTWLTDFISDSDQIDDLTIVAMIEASDELRIDEYDDIAHVFQEKSIASVGLTLTNDIEQDVIMITALISHK
jgi:hypothetical protein